MSKAFQQVAGKRKTNHGKSALFAGGGDVALKKLFKGKDDVKEELAEARAIKSGKITPMQYAKGEKMEDAKKMARGGGVELRGKTRGACR